MADLQGKPLRCLAISIVNFAIRVSALLSNNYEIGNQDEKFEPNMEDISE